jgi:hypothetical protein
LFAIWNQQLFMTLPVCGLQEVTNTPNHQKNHPPQAAHFNWIFDKVLLAMDGSIGGCFCLSRDIIHRKSEGGTAAEPTPPAAGKKPILA